MDFTRNSVFRMKERGISRAREGKDAIPGRRGKGFFQHEGLGFQKIGAIISA
jgi:hypothetical protein